MSKNLTAKNLRELYFGIKQNSPIRIRMNMIRSQTWKRLSVSKKIYFVVGMLTALILFEFASLFFAMETLSTLRAYVGGEGVWSKAQKDAVINLYKYTYTRDPLHYQAFLNEVATTLGDKQAREELHKTHPNDEIIADGFKKGKVHPDDIPGVIRTTKLFFSNSYIQKIFWRPD